MTPTSSKLHIQYKELVLTTPYKASFIYNHHHPPVRKTTHACFYTLRYQIYIETIRNPLSSIPEITPFLFKSIQIKLSKSNQFPVSHRNPYLFHTNPFPKFSIKTVPHVGGHRYTQDRTPTYNAIDTVNPHLCHIKHPRDHAIHSKSYGNLHTHVIVYQILVSISNLIRQISYQNE